VVRLASKLLPQTTTAFAVCLGGENVLRLLLNQLGRAAPGEVSRSVDERERTAKRFGAVCGAMSLQSSAKLYGPPRSSARL
jgi:hypothetical protein